MEELLAMIGILSVVIIFFSMCCVCDQIIRIQNDDESEVITENEVIRRSDVSDEDYFQPDYMDEWTDQDE